MTIKDFSLHEKFKKRRLIGDPSCCSLDADCAICFVFVRSDQDDSEAAAAGSLDVRTLVLDADLFGLFVW